MTEFSSNNFGMVRWYHKLIYLKTRNHIIMSNYRQLNIQLAVIVAKMLSDELVLPLLLFGREQVV